MKPNQLFRVFLMCEVADDADPVIVDPLDTEAVKKSFDTMGAQKRHWREKAIDPSTGKSYKELFEEAAKKAAPLPTADPEVKKPDNASPSTPDADWLFDNIDAISSLTPEERTELRTTAKELNVEPVKFIKSKAGQAQLEKIRAEKKSTNATPSPSNAVPTFKGKPIKDVLTDSNATPAEKQEAYESRMKGTRGNNSAV